MNRDAEKFGIEMKLKHAKKGINQKNYNFCDIK